MGVGFTKCDSSATLSHSMRPYPNFFVTLALLGALPGSACSGDADGARAATAVVEPRPSTRSDDPRVVAARKAVDEGRASLARSLVDQIGDAAGVEGLLLAARIASLEEDDMEAGRLVEDARADYGLTPDWTRRAVEECESHARELAEMLL